MPETEQSGTVGTGLFALFFVFSSWRRGALLISLRLWVAALGFFGFREAGLTFAFAIRFVLEKRAGLKGTKPGVCCEWLWRVLAVFWRRQSAFFRLRRGIDIPSFKGGLLVKETKVDRWLEDVNGNRSSCSWAVSAFSFFLGAVWNMLGGVELISCVAGWDAGASSVLSQGGTRGAFAGVVLREKKRRRSLRRMVCIPGFEKGESFALRDDGRFLVYTTWGVTGLFALSCRLFAPLPSRRKAAVG